jgi:PAS domain S-box-containing protein/putative nucleotidyltransferase with HDIG domain
MNTIFKNLFAPVSFPENDEKNRISRILYTFWINLWVVVGLYIIGLFVYVKKQGALLILVLNIVILLIVRYFHRRGKIRFASFLLLIGLWLSYMTVVVLTGTIRTSMIAMPIAITVMAVSLLGLRAGVLCAAMTLMVTFGVMLLEITGNQPPSYFPGAPLSNWYHLVTAFALVIIPLGQTWRDLSTALGRAQKNKHKHRRLFEEANDGIFIIRDSKFVDCNTRILEMFEAKREDIIGKRPSELSPETQPNGQPTVIMEQEMLKAALVGERQFFEWKHLRQDQSEFDVEVSLNLLELDDEKLVQAIVRDITERKQTEKKLAEAYDTTLEGWAKALELRDKETEDHSRRVVELTLILAQEMGIEGEDLIHIRRGAILHDIGKMGVPDEILLKPGKLTLSERKIVEKHPIYSYELLSHIPHLEKAMDIPYCHHEHWDGNGYPRGLKGEEIPLAARIFSVIDVWDALLSDRPYGKAWSRAEVIEHIKQESGKYFAPDVVAVFLKLVEEGEV